MDLIGYVTTKVDPKEYYESVLDDVRWPGGNSEARVKSPFRNEKTPSFSLNPTSGAWFDHGTGTGGRSVVSFHARYYEISSREAAIELFNQYIQPIIKPTMVRKFARSLEKTPSFRSILTQRLISSQVIRAYQLGTTGTRISIPIINEYGVATNIKLYLPKAKPKMLNWTDRTRRKYGETSLFPVQRLIEATDDETIFICEGELDALALISLGLCAVSSTAGCKSWPSQYNRMFTNRDVVICYDNDKDGTTYDQRVRRELLSYARSIRRINIPKAVGKDVTDWLQSKRSMRSADAWKQRAKKSRLLLERRDEVVGKNGHTTVSLNDASQAKYTNKPIEVSALVTGKDVSPYILPREVHVSCDGSCDSCPVKQRDSLTRTVQVEDNESILRLVAMKTEARVAKEILRRSGINPGCAKVELVATQNVERMVVIPTIDSGEQYVMRNILIRGHGIMPNRSYRMKGTTLPDPETQQAVHIFDEINPIQGEAEKFEIDTADVKLLRRMFSPRKGQTVSSKLADIADWQSRHITKIRMRPDLHTIIDLAFHSAGSFVFNKEPIKRGMLDVLVMGDTRCGKGYVTERLVNYYRLGEVASGENCSFAGLIGGCEQVNKRFIVKWGLIPLNNNRLVVIDEASALSREDFGGLSRVRSEGVAEISKIVRESTQANTRLVWLSNSRVGKAVVDYTYGVAMIPELVGNPEDVSRFDLAMIVATGEVPSVVINTVEQLSTSDPEKYDRSLMRKLVLWAWSRPPGSIKFSDEAVRTVIRTAMALGKKYSPKIPLVQAENIRVKLAKVSTAVAARLFSTPDGETLEIKKQHVLYAYKLMTSLYDRGSMSYQHFSESEDVMQTPSEAITFDLSQRIIEFLMSREEISEQMIRDHKDGDMFEVLAMLSELVKGKALVRGTNGNYSKTPWFTKWLQERRLK